MLEHPWTWAQGKPVVEFLLGRTATKAVHRKATRSVERSTPFWKFSPLRNRGLEKKTNFRGRPGRLFQRAERSTIFQGKI